MIRFSKLTLRRGAKVLLQDADAAINPGERVGLVGANGSGKSSLFALLRGELHADQGEVDFPAHWRIAHVAQETPALERPAVEYAIDGDDVFRSLERELSETHDGVRIAELHTALGDAGAYGRVMASTYNARPLCAEVLVDGDAWRVIREAGTYEDLVRGESP